MNDQQVISDTTRILAYSEPYPWVDTLLYNGEKASNLPLIGLLSTGAFLFFLFFVIRKVVVPLIKRRSLKEPLQRIIPIAEAISTIIFFIITVFYLVIPFPLLGLIFLGIIVAASWKFLKDYFSGLLFRFADKFREGHGIRIEERSGVIKHLGRLSAEIEIENGEALLMPYSKLVDSTLIREARSENIRSKAIELEVPAKLLSTEIKPYLRSKILSLPWSVSSREPFIERIEKEGSITYRLVLYALDEKYFPLMERQLKKEL